MELLTNSALKTARSCLRLYELRYRKGWRVAKEAHALRFGTLVHKALEAWWLAAMRCVSGDERLFCALAAMGADADPYDLARARALMIGYDARWGDQDLDVLAVEAQFETELLNPETGKPSKTWRLAGKMDAIVRDRETGHVQVVEHKTSSEDVSPGSDYWRRLRMDSQVSVYYAGATSLGHDVAGCLYDVISKPGQKPYKKTAEIKKNKDGADRAGQRLTDETPTEYEARIVEAISADPNGYYQRGPVVRLERDMREAMTDVWQFAQYLRDAQRTGCMPRNPNSCVSFGRSCEFLDHCASGDSLENDTRFTKIAVTHPELSQEATDGAA